MGADLAVSFKQNHKPGFGYLQKMLRHIDIGVQD